MRGTSKIRVTHELRGTHEMNAVMCIHSPESSRIDKCPILDIAVLL